MSGVGIYVALFVLWVEMAAIDMGLQEYTYGNLKKLCVLLIEEYRAGHVTEWQQWCSMFCNYFLGYGVHMRPDRMCVAMNARFCAVLEEMLLVDLMTRRLCARVLAAYYTGSEARESDQVMYSMHGRVAAWM